MSGEGDGGDGKSIPALLRPHGRRWSCHAGPRRNPDDHAPAEAPEAAPSRQRQPASTPVSIAGEPNWTHMGKRQKVVLKALAEHGLPQMWANEQETAALSGLSAERFRLLLPSLEQSGLPRQNPINCKRPIPAILAFWRLKEEAVPEPSIEEMRAENRARENWSNQPSPRKNAQLPKDAITAQDPP